MIEQIRDICSGCDTLQLIQNKKHWLCPDCVFKKNHGGKDKQVIYKERHAKKEDKKRNTSKPDTTDKVGLVATLKKTFSIKKISNKRAERHAELKKIYKEIDNEREPICEGCGKNLALSHSHLLSEYNRPDLYTDKDNIRLHCFYDYHSCHSTWERGLIDELVNMLDFKENLAYIKEVDIKVYNKIIAKAEFEGVKIC